MLQRNDTSIRLPYWPPSDSPIASPNQRYSTVSMHRMPRPFAYGAHGWPLTQPAAPSIVSSIDAPPSSGQNDGPGTK